MKRADRVEVRDVGSNLGNGGALQLVETVEDKGSGFGGLEGLSRHVLENPVGEVGDSAETRQVSASEDVLHARHARHDTVQVFVSFDGEVSAIDHARNTEISPKGTRADRAERNDRKSEVLSDIDGEAEDPVRNDTGHRPIWSGHQLFEQRLGYALDVIECGHDVVTSPRVVYWEAVRYGLESEVRVGSETSLDVGMLEEAMVDVLGVDEGDVETGQGEELGKLEHGVDMALSS